jgi:hypothetical protein
MTSYELRKWYRTQICGLAERYGISLVTECRSRDFVPGPTGGGFSVARRRVQWCNPYGYGSVHDFAVFNLHELAHCVCQPPTLDTDLVAEHWILFTLEASWMRLLRKELAPRWRSDLTKAFGLYQRSGIFTPFIHDQIPLHDFYGVRIGEVTPRTARWWREPNAVELGIVTPEYAPTWQWPTWPTDRLGMYHSWIQQHRRTFRLNTAELRAITPNWSLYLHPELRA